MSEIKGKRCYFGGIEVINLIFWVDWEWNWMENEGNGENEVIKEEERRRKCWN